jgi:hypothetical protein
VNEHQLHSRAPFTNSKHEFKTTSFYEDGPMKGWLPSTVRDRYEWTCRRPCGCIMYNNQNNEMLLTNGVLILPVFFVICWACFFAFSVVYWLYHLFVFIKWRTGLFLFCFCWACFFAFSVVYWLYHLFVFIKRRESMVSFVWKTHPVSYYGALSGDSMNEQ